MAGARGGWAEAPYATVPCPPGPASFARAATRDPRLAVRILPGLRQDSPADVMRGEETQIAGLLAAEPGFEGVACLPGTHTKWVHLSAGEVVSFASYMTGEIFALLADRLGAAQDGRRRTAGPSADFLQAVEDGIARPERVASRLFGLRAEALLHGLAPERARARLSGLLIGAELAGARPYWLGREVVLIGADRAGRGLPRRAGARRPRGAHRRCHRHDPRRPRRRPRAASGRKDPAHEPQPDRHPARVEPGEAVAIGTTLVEAGITWIEVPLNSPRAAEEHRGAAGRRSATRARIGAGTVLQPEEVRAVAATGATLHRFAELRPPGDRPHQGRSASAPTPASSPRASASRHWRPAPTR